MKILDTKISTYRKSSVYKSFLHPQKETVSDWGGKEGSWGGQVRPQRPRPTSIQVSTAAVRGSSGPSPNPSHALPRLDHASGHPFCPGESEGPTIDIGGDLPEDGKVRVVHDAPEDPVNPALVVDEDGLLGHPEGHDPHGQQEEEEEDVLHLQRQGGTGCSHRRPTRSVPRPGSAPRPRRLRGTLQVLGARRSGETALGLPHVLTGR